MWGVAADEQYVYWTNQDPSGAVARAPVGGGPTTTLSTLGPAHEIIASAGTLFYLGETSQTPGDQVLFSLPVEGGTPTVLVAESAVNASLATLTVDCSNVYFVATAGDLVQVPRAGGAPTTLVKGQASCRLDIAVDASRVYFRGNAGVATVPIGGGDVTILSPSGGDSIAVDANAVYWSDLAAGTVMKLAK